MEFIVSLAQELRQATFMGQPVRAHADKRHGRSADSALEAQLRASGMEVIASELAAAPHALHYLSRRPGPRALFCTLA